MVGWSIPSSSVSDPTWTPAGPGRSRPSPSSPPPTPFARASAAVWNFFAVVVVVAAGGEAGTAGDASRLFLLDLDLLCEGPRSRGAGIGPGRSSSSAASGGGADSSSRGTRSWTAADPGVSAASFPALFSSSRWTGAGVATRDATAGFGGRSSRTSPAEGPRAAGTARVGARSGERTSGGGFAHAFPASGVETTSAWATVTPPPLLGCWAAGRRRRRRRRQRARREGASWARRRVRRGALGTVAGQGSRARAPRRSRRAFPAGERRRRPRPRARPRGPCRGPRGSRASDSPAAGPSWRRTT